MYIDVNYVNKPSKLHIFFVFKVTSTEIQLTATNGRLVLLCAFFIIDNNKCELVKLIQYLKLRYNYNKFLIYYRIEKGKICHFQ